MSVSQRIGELPGIKRGVHLSKILTRIIWLCMLPLLLVATILAIFQIREIHKDQLDKASSLAKIVALYTDNAINSRIKGLGMLAASPFVDDQTKWHLLYLEAQSFQQSFGTHVVITDGNEQPQLLLSTRRPFGTKLPVVKNSNGRLAGPMAIRTGKPAVSDLFYGPIDHDPLIGIAVPVVQEGAAKFVILTILSADFFRSQIERISLPSGWHLTLKDAQENTIAQVNPPIRGKSTSRVVANSTISNWQIEIEIPPIAHWKPILSAALALATILLVATLTGFLSGKRVGRRVGKAIVSLAETDSSDIATPDEITEIAAARELIRKQVGRRISVEHALRDKMLEYEAMFERSVVGMAMTDLAMGHFLKVNQALADMLGYSTVELCRMTLLEITHPDDRECKVQGFKSVRSGNAHQWQNEIRYIRKDGTSIWVSIAGNTIYSDNGIPVRTIAVIQDITERQKASEALKTSEKKYRELVEAANSIILRWDKQGKIRFVNDFGLRFFEYTANELIGRDVMTIVPRVEKSSGRELDALVNEILCNPEDYSNVPNENITKDGRTVWVAWTNKAIFDDHGEVREILAIGNDITAMKQSEQALNLSEKRYRAFFENSLDAVLLAGLDGSIFSANRAACEMFGRTEKQLSNLGTEAIVDPTDPCLTEALKQRSRTGVFKGELTCIRKDNTRFPGEFSSAVYDGPEGEQRISMSIRDISDRKQAEEALRESEFLYRAIAANFPDGAIYVFDHDLRFRVADGQALSRLGYTRDGLEGKTIWEATDQEVCQILERRYPLVLAGESLHFETVVKERRFSSNYVPIRNEDGKVIAGMVVSHDITERKRTEEELLENKNRILAALNEKDVLLKEIHHRVKNNMQVISSLVDLQADEVKEPAMRRVFQDVIYRIHSMAMVHEKLYQSHDLARVEFADYATGLLSYLWQAQGEAAKDILLNLDLKPVYLSISQAVPCGLILNELFSNALKHAFKGRDTGQVTVSLWEDDRQIHLSVKDNGIGLPLEMDWKQSQTLGLRIVKTLTRQINAALEVRNGQGTQFILNFQRPQNEQ